MCETRFFVCKHCGNFVDMIHSSGVPMVCCGENMTEIKANVEEASTEKHLPAVTVDGNIIKVAVGSVQHPMLENHYIQWIYLQTEEGVQRKCLKPGDVPEATFALSAGDKLIAVYEHCNIHGLWKTTM